MPGQRWGGSCSGGSSVMHKAAVRDGFPAGGASQPQIPAWPGHHYTPVVRQAGRSSTAWKVAADHLRLCCTPTISVRIMQSAWQPAVTTPLCRDRDRQKLRYKHFNLYNFVMLCSTAAAQPKADLAYSGRVNFPTIHAKYKTKVVDKPEKNTIVS